MGDKIRLKLIAVLKEMGNVGVNRDLFEAKLSRMKEDIHTKFLKPVNMIPHRI